MMCFIYLAIKTARFCSLLYLPHKETQNSSELMTIDQGIDLLETTIKRSLNEAGLLKRLTNFQAPNSFIGKSSSSSRSVSIVSNTCHPNRLPKRYRRVVDEMKRSFPAHVSIPQLYHIANDSRIDKLHGTQVSTVHGITKAFSALIPLIDKARLANLLADIGYSQQAIRIFVHAIFGLIDTKSSNTELSFFVNRDSYGYKAIYAAIFSISPPKITFSELNDLFGDDSHYKVLVVITFADIYNSTPKAISLCVMASSASIFPSNFLDDPSFELWLPKIRAFLELIFDHENLLARDVHNSASLAEITPFVPFYKAILDSPIALAAIFGDSALQKTMVTFITSLDKLILSLLDLDGPCCLFHELNNMLNIDELGFIIGEMVVYRGSDEDQLISRRIIVQNLLDSLSSFEGEPRPLFRSVYKDLLLSLAVYLRMYDPDHSYTLPLHLLDHYLYREALLYQLTKDELSSALTSNVVDYSLGFDIPHLPHLTSNATPGIKLTMSYLALHLYLSESLINNWLEKLTIDNLLRDSRGLDYNSLNLMLSHVFKQILNVFHSSTSKILAKSDLTDTITDGIDDIGATECQDYIDSYSNECATLIDDFSSPNGMGTLPEYSSSLSTMKDCISLASRGFNGVAVIISGIYLFTFATSHHEVSCTVERLAPYYELPVSELLSSISPNFSANHPILTSKKLNNLIDTIIVSADETLDTIRRDDNFIYLVTLLVVNSLLTGSDVKSLTHDYVTYRRMKFLFSIWPLTNSSGNN